ncbi:MAG: hypothetical protein GY854_13780 [Deltaproteobacteria bacterium]|nr:hypothetical protein [Deltaproteobacteria bacterium]
MYQTGMAAHAFDTVTTNWSADNLFSVEAPARQEDILEAALSYLDSGNALEADRLLTAALLKDPDDHRLWLAAGIARLRRGAIRAAACAFEMSAWISNDPEARELLALCEEGVL